MDDIIKNLCNAIFVALLGIVVERTLIKCIDIAKERIYSKNNFDLSGIWVATSTGITQDVKTLEVLFLKQKEEDIFTEIYHYNNLRNITVRYFASGYFRSNSLYVVYKNKNRGSTQIGSLMLRLEDNGKILRGKYTEYNNRNSLSSADSIDGEYCATRFDLPLLYIFKHVILRKCFSSYEKALSIINKGT